MHNNWKATKIFLILFTVIIAVSLNNVFVTALTKLPPCEEVTNPEFYKNLVYASDIYSYFQDWNLKNTTVPCHEKFEPIKVILIYDIPKSYSSNNLNYQTTIIFSFKDDQLINSEELNQTFKNYKQNIADFENDERIKLFIKTTDATKVIHKETQVFELISQPREYLHYNFINKSIVSLSFSNPVLIDNIVKFIPQIYSIPRISEFKFNANITRIDLNYNKLFLGEDAICTKCKQYIEYTLDDMIPTTYSLDNTFEWKTFPEVSQTRNIIETNLSNSNWSNCKIFKNIHVEFHYSPDTPWYMTVSLDCVGAISWTEASLSLNPDGTYDRLSIKTGDAKKQSSITNSKSIIVLIGVIIVFIGIIAVSMKFRKK